MKPPAVIHKPSKPVRPRVQLALAEGSTVIGLDLSLTSTGFAVWRSGRTTHRTIHPRYRGLLRIDDLAVTVLDACTEAQAALVVIEGLNIHSPSSSVAESCGAWYTVALGIVGAGMPLVAVAPMTLKKCICGTGAAKKEHMMMRISMRYGVQASNSDEADAIGLAHFGAMLSGLEVPNIQQTECLGKAWRIE